MVKLLYSSGMHLSLKYYLKARTHAYETQSTRNTAWGALVSSSPSPLFTTTRVLLRLLLWRLAKGISSSCVARITGKAAKFIENWFYSESYEDKLTLFHYSYLQINTRVTFYIGKNFELLLSYYNCHITPKFVRYGRLYKTRAQHPCFRLTLNVCCGWNESRIY